MSEAKRGVPLIPKAFFVYHATPANKRVGAKEYNTAYKARWRAKKKAQQERERNNNDNQETKDDTNQTGT